MTRKYHPWAALSALCLGFFMILLDSSIVNTAVPAMITGLHASLNEIFWVNSVYLLTFAVPLLLSGRLGDRFGPRRMYVFGLIVFTLASLWCGFADSATALIIARAVQGLGAAALTPQSMAFIVHLFPTNRGAAMGMWAAVAGAATVSGPVIGGLVVQSIGWEWIFFVNVPVGVVALVLVFTLVPNWQPKHSHRFDVPGILLSSLGLLALVFGLQNGQQYHWGTVFGGVTITEILLGGVALLVAFVFWQARNKREPLLPLALFTSRSFSFGNMTNLCIGFAMTAQFIPIMIFLQSVRDLTPLEAGLFSAPVAVLAGVLGPFAGRLSDRINGKYIVMVGLAVYALGIGSLSLFAAPDVNLLLFVPGMVLNGIGIGLIFSPLSATAIAGLQPRMMGAGSGIFSMSRQIGNLLGSAGGAVLLQARLAATMPDAIATQAATLPADVRPQFVSAMAKSVNGIPAGLPENLRHAADTAFQDGFATAMSQTLLLPAGLLVLGLFFSSRMRNRAQPPQPVVAPARPAEKIAEPA
ncbi:DHA2 family efflux MFS transporter permease subunit [Actinocrispum wychmicini]|uniref:EmrB/QacA subfamily drug resistance transporter n=1 Tax=Actinocrispum wychmicini TaxID=1213861 RepID=A0A4R2K013_9PSEU|nr:DHA2 family efflux MFS transporter permease subunit [Actinocrispum wychmicini]TCO65604.1 EmrB/QacA subfamily drug resistance transporter [Actinocrispum wychmicini]